MSAEAENITNVLMWLFSQRSLAFLPLKNLTEELKKKKKTKKLSLFHSANICCQSEKFSWFKVSCIFFLFWSKCLFDFTTVRHTFRRQHSWLTCESEKCTHSSQDCVSTTVFCVQMQRYQFHMCLSKSSNRVLELHISHMNTCLRKTQREEVSLF